MRAYNQHNLLSALYLTRTKFYVVIILHDKILFKCDSALLFTASIVSNNSATLNGQVIPSSALSTTVSSYLLDWALWHRRFAHLNHENVRKLHNQHLVQGMVVKSKSLPDLICKPCIIGKQHCSNVSKHAFTHASTPLQLVHSDVHDILPIKSKYSYKY